MRGFNPVFRAMQEYRLLLHIPVSEGLQYHIRCKPGDVAPYVLLPGDPGRVPRIAKFMDEAWEVARNREYLTYTGRYKGVPVSVTSTGIGGPSAAIAVEELIRVGAKVFIRVGTSGGMQPFTKPGDIGIATGAVRDEGTTRQYVPIEYPALADYRIVSALVEAAERLGVRYHVGIFHSKDSFYCEVEPENQPAREIWMNRWNAWVRAGVILSEMEAAAIFVVSSIKGALAGAVCAIIDVSGGEEIWRLNEQGIDNAIRTALEAVKILADRGIPG